MEEIERLTKELLEAIQRSDLYQDLRRREEYLMADPELWERVRAFRSENFRFQQEKPENRALLGSSIGPESQALRLIPGVGAYLDAELALCRMLQQLVITLTEGIEMDIPDL